MPAPETTARSGSSRCWGTSRACAPSARLVKGETAYLSEDELGGGSPCWLASEAWGTWRFYSARLPSGAAYHGLLVPELAAYACDRRDFLLLARSEDEAPGVTEG